MITFKQYLLEDRQDLVEYLRTHCMEACKTYVEANQVLWRGVKIHGKQREKIDFTDQGVEGYEISVRTDRGPRDTDIAIHQEADKFFKEKFGIALRSESVFAHSNKSRDLEDFGHPMVIFPHGHFDIYWSEDIRDFTVEVIKNKNEDVELADWLGELLERGNYKKGPNVEAMQTLSFFEKMVVCKKYLAVDYSYARDAIDVCKKVIG